jgi:hypothetical protein
MSRDHLSRIATACSFLGLGCLMLAAAFVPAQWQLSKPSIAVGCLALFISAMLSRRNFVHDFMERKPSGPVRALKGVFAAVGVVGFLLAVLGLALVFWQKPFGDGPRNFPASLLAVFSLHALVCAYLVLAATGRAGRRNRRNGA